MGICNQNTKKIETFIFTPKTLFTIKSRNIIYTHLKRYLLTKKYFLVQTLRYIIIYDLETTKILYKLLFPDFALFTLVKDDLLFGIGKDGFNAILINISTKKSELRTFPEQKNPFHDIITMNENIVIFFRPQLLIIYEVTSGKIEQIQINKMNYIFDTEYTLGDIIKINETIIAINYVELDEGHIYDIIDITTKQIITKLKVSPFSPIFINIKTARTSLKDLQSYTKNIKNIKFIFLSCYAGKIVIDYEYYDDIKYIKENNIIKKLSRYFKLENLPIYIINNYNDIIAFNSKLKQIVQTMSKEDYLHYIRLGWHIFGYSDPFFILAYETSYFIFKIDINKNYKGKRKYYWKTIDLEKEI